MAFVFVTIVACSNADSPTADEAKALSEAEAMAAQLQGTAADNPLCRLFTPVELVAYVGEPLERGENAAMGSGCMWWAQDGEGDVLIQVAPKDYHANPYMAEGYEELPDIGIEGNVSQAMGGWIAAAIIGEETVVASVTGKTADAAQAEALLRELIARRGQ
jgi:hypothetical protein